MKETHEEFVKEFIDALKNNASEFKKRGIKIDKKDHGIFINDFLEYYIINETDEFTNQFYRTYGKILGDLSGNSPFLKLQNPFTIRLEYKGHDITSTAIGKSVYKTGVLPTFTKIAELIANNFLLPEHIAELYLQGDKKSRDTLLFYLDFQSHRSWEVVWAKTDWIRFCFPKCYDAMMKDGEFLSVKELEEKMKEEIKNES